MSAFACRVSRGEIAVHEAKAIDEFYDAAACAYPNLYKCDGCESDGVAVWCAVVSKRATIFDMLPIKDTVRLCKRCLCLKNKETARLVSAKDLFVAQQRHCRLKYAHLIDAMRAQMAYVMEKPFLYELYQKVAVTGATIGKHDLETAWTMLLGARRPAAVQ